MRAVTPRRGHPLGKPLVDRTLADGRVVRAVAGFEPVATHELAEAVSLLHDTARHAPPLALRVGDIDPARWFELLEPVRTLLVQHGVLLNVHVAMISSTQDLTWASTSESSPPRDARPSPATGVAGLTESRRGTVSSQEEGFTAG